MKKIFHQFNKKGNLILTKVKNYFFKDKKGYAKGLCSAKLFLIFAIFSVFGTYYEQILTLVMRYMDKGIISWELRRGVIYGPFSPIYGGGAVIFAIFLLRKDISNWKTFLYASLIGGIFEFEISFLQETFVGTTSWDYSGYFLNIGGRTTIPFMAVWGIMGLIFAKYLYPKISKFIENAPYNLMRTFTICLAIFLSLDMLVSWTALLRQNLRRKGFEPLTPIGELYDQVYPDEVLKKYFPNMEAK